MTRTDYTDLGETAFRGVTSQGLPVIVVPKQDFTKKIAYFAASCGSIHREYTRDGETVLAPEGVAHYLEHMLFDLPDRDIPGEFAALGANPNAFTGFDSTCYYFSCTENFDACLHLLLEFVSSPRFTREALRKENGIITQEIGMNDDSPDSRVYENLMAAMYETHPIRIPILGTRQTIGQITPEVLSAFHRSCYHPRNMVLCVVGDVDPEAVFAAAEQTLPAFPPLPGALRHHWEESMTCRKSLVTDRMDVSRPLYHIAFKSEPLPDGDSGAAMELAGDMASEFLFGESSPLYSALYEEGLIDGSFGGGFDSLDGAAFLLCSGEGEHWQQIRDRILRRAEEILQEGIDPEEFRRVKRSFLGRRMKSLDSFDATCFRMCAYHMSQCDYFRFPELFRAVTPQDILQFLRRVVTPERCCISVILPETEAPYAV